MSKALVIIHFYYLNQVDTILKLLKNVSVKYDLYCTIGNKKHYEQIRKKILNFKKDAHIVKVANVGYDIWPFIYIINNVNLNKYKYIIKLHTKRNIPGKNPCPIGNDFFVESGSHWRKCLFSFIETKENFEKCINALEKTNIGACTRFNLIHSIAKHGGVVDYTKNKWPKYFYDLYNFNFVAGTMFIAKAEPFKLLKNMEITENLFEKPTKNHKTQFAHVIERRIGEIFYKSRMKITDPFTPEEYKKDLKRQYRHIKWIKRFINYIVYMCFITKYRKKLRRKLQDVFYIPRIKLVAKKDKEYLIK